MPEISHRRQLPEDVMSDEEKQRALYQDVCHSNTLNITPPWYLKNSRYPVRDGNNFHVYCSGEEVFAAIADSILNAKKSVDIACTFFDPAMPFVRKALGYSLRDPEKNNNRDENGNYQWRAQGTSYWRKEDAIGEIILQALRSNKNLRVRLVLWYSEVAVGFSGPNIIGVHPQYYDDHTELNECATGFSPQEYKGVDPKTRYTDEEVEEILKDLRLRRRGNEAKDYSLWWFQHVVWGNKNYQSHYIPDADEYLDRITITYRAIITPPEIADEDLRLGVNEVLALSGGCDHQKCVLIDIDDISVKNPNAKPHGYVLGHNYLTQYWSSFPFVHRDPKSEMDRAPYHDFSMRVEGPLLIDINNNFCEAWGAKIHKSIFGDLRSQRIGIVGKNLVPKDVPAGNQADKKPLYYWLGDAAMDLNIITAINKKATQVVDDFLFGTPPHRSLHDEDPDKLYHERNARITPILMTQRAGSARGQLVRTRPDQLLHGAQEKEIKDAYMQVVRHAHNYLLIVNQYFQYSKLIRQIKHWKKINDDAVKCQIQDRDFTPRTLYLFMGTCKPENHGMLFRTQQMVNEIGLGHQFETAFNEMYDANKQDETGHYALTKDGENLSANAHITENDILSMHIKPLLFMYYTSIPKDESDRKVQADHVAQQVYVHAKLMIEDDVFFTLGSANTNIRSMAVDSELNIISDDKDTAQRVRHQLLSSYVGTINAEGGEEFPNKPQGELTQDELAKIYKIMKVRMIDNKAKIKDGETISGSLVKFQDERVVVGVGRVG